MPKHKPGLHKEISLIFKGVPFPQRDGTGQPPSRPRPECPTPIFPKLTPPEQPGPPQEVHGTAVTEPESRRPAPLPPKAAPSMSPRVAIVTKPAGPNKWQELVEQVRKKLFTSKPGVGTARQKTMTILVPVLSIALIFVLIRVFSTPSRKTTKTPGFGPSNAIASVGNYKSDWQIPEPWPANLRDPMQFGSATTTPGESSKLIVKGIVYSEDNRSAVIGTQIVREGDTISNATVIKINKNSVEFEMDGKKWTQDVQH